MMQTILLSLLGLAVVLHAESQSVESFDSAESGNTETYNGVVVTVYAGDCDPDTTIDCVPEVKLQSKLDDHKSTYCLSFNRIFESEDYALYDADGITVCREDCAYSEVTDSAVNLVDASCEVTEVTTSSFHILCANLNEVDTSGGAAPSGTLDIAFSFTKKGVNPGLNFVFTIDEYEYESASEDVQLVLEQEVVDCSDDNSYSGESGDDSDDEADSPESTTTESPETRRRVLLEGEDDDGDDGEDAEDAEDEDLSGSGSKDEEDGASSDSGEFDVGYSELLMTATSAKCTPAAGETNEGIEADLEYFTTMDDKKTAHIRFNKCVGKIVLDPWYGFDAGKTSSSSRISWSVWAGIMVGFVMLLC